MKNDKTYYEFRERAEMLAARQAAYPASAAVHAELAQRYKAIAWMLTREAGGATANEVTAGTVGTALRQVTEDA